RNPADPARAASGPVRASRCPPSAQAELLEARLHAVEPALIGHHEPDLTHARRLRLAKDEGMMLLVLGAAQVDATVVALGLVQANQIDVEIPGALEVGGPELDVPQSFDAGDVLDASCAHADPPPLRSAHHIDTPGTTD